MTDEHRINELMAGSSDAEFRRRREVEELAEKLYVVSYEPGSQLERLAEESFQAATAWLNERDFRREVKR